MVRQLALSGTLLLTMMLRCSPAAAQAPAPEPPSDQQPNLMKILTDRGVHDTEHERWNAYGQFTYISSWKPSFKAPYTNLNGSINSLLPVRERSFTGTATLYLGAALWKGAE